MTDISSRIVQRIEAARRDREPLSIVAGASKRFLGRTSNGSKLEVAAHEGIVSYEPGELVLTVRAGTRLTEIAATLAEHGQALQFEPPHLDGAATIGGTLACNASGPARPWSGSVRDAVLGIELVTGRAERLRFGGRVMKNVAGFDVSRLQAGALGAFGVITEVSLKVLPRPRHSVTLARVFDAADAIVHMNELAGTSKPLSGACWHDGSLYVRFSGAESAVEAAARQWGGERLDPVATSRRNEALDPTATPGHGASLDPAASPRHDERHDPTATAQRGEPPSDAPSFWRDLAEQRLKYFRTGSPLWRFSIRSSAPLPRIDGDWLIDWGGAQRWIHGDFDKNELERLAESAGGHVSLYRGGNRESEVHHALPAAQKSLHLRLKDAFDPDRILNPGRLYGWM